MGLAEEIGTRNKEFMAAFASQDANACATFYTPDCHFMPHGKDGIDGVDGVRQYFEQDMSEGVKKVVLVTVEVNGSGDWAFERGSYTLDGIRGPETGNYLIIWKKVGGKWLMYTDCFNVVNPAQG